MKGSARRLLASTNGAVAPTVALSLFALIAAGGIAFDYARLAALDSELQQAADQAALAAATQLDGSSGAMLRAEAAARSLLTNETRFGNDGGGLVATIPTDVAQSSLPQGQTAPDPAIKFYASRDDAEADTNGWFRTSGTATATDARARFVRVHVAAREAIYAFTPVVNAFSSGAINALATAGLGSSICKVPPVMLCNPDEAVGNTSETLKFAPVPGKGMRLVTGSATVPGNFGWLEAGLDNGTPALAAALGYNSPPGDCQPITGVETKTGMDTAVLSAFNTRFDVFANGNTTCPSQGGGICSPSPNTRKDLECKSNDSGATCQNAWVWNSAEAYKLPTDTTTTTTYRDEETCTKGKPPHVCTTTQVPVTTTTTTTVARALKDGDTYPKFMGFPRDYCHMFLRDSATCGGDNIIGDGQWDRDAYFKVNYGWTNTQWTNFTGLAAAAGSAGITRWQVYNWELLHPLVSQAAGTDCSAGSSGCVGINASQSLGSNNYALSKPANGIASVAASTSQADRRRISVAVINCRALNVRGKTEGIPVPTWLEVFLVEPAWNRGSGSNIYTDQKDIYVEVIGETAAAGNASAGQVVRRDVPYLIR